MGLLKLVIIFFLCTSCVFWNEISPDYNRLIAPVKKKKLSESHPFLVDGKEEPEFPDEELNNETILGVDSNRDGVRDDLEIFINRTAKDRNERLSLRQYVRYAHVELERWNHVSVNELYKMNSDIAKSGECFLYISRRHDNIDLLKKIIILIYNNSLREEASRASGFKLRGEALGSGISATESYKGCEFAVDDLDRIKRSNSPGKVKE